MKGPCDNCGSSNANHTFPSGATFCYSCRTSTGDLPKGTDPGAAADEFVEAPAPRAAKPGALLHVEIRSLVKRGIREDTCAKWGYGVATHNGETVQVAQYCDSKGTVVGQKLRYADKRFEILGSLKDAGLYGQWLWRDGGKMVVVVEGEVDALSFSQLQDNKYAVVSVPNGAQSAAKAVAKSIEWLEKFDKVVFMLDNDEHGKAATAACCEILSPGKAYIATLPLKDANEMLVAGRGKEAISAMWEARVYRPDGVLDGDEIWEKAWAQDLPDGYTWIHRGLQEKTRGMRLGEVSTFVAGTGSGKSTFFREQVLDLMFRQDVKVGVLALEENTRRTLLGFLSIFQEKPLHFYKNAELDKGRMLSDWKKINARLSVYDHQGVRDHGSIFAKIRYMGKALACKVIVLDHVSIVVSGMDQNDDERRTLDLIYTKLTSLAAELNCHIAVVCHLRRPQGQSHEEGRQISLSDLRGTGGIAQMSFDVLALERNQQDPDTSLTSTLRVLKCRHTGDLGIAGEMAYDPETSRMREVRTEFEHDDTGTFSGAEEVPGAGVPKLPEPAVEAVRQDVPRVRAARRKGKMEPAVQGHGGGPAGSGDVEEG